MKILVVDDEPLVTESFERVIGRLQHTPLTAGNGARAIELYKENKPDMVLLDMNLPDIKGDRVFREIKSFDKDAVVYFITGYSEEYMKAKELDAAGCFHKPLMIEQVMELIDERKKIVDQKELKR
jgi:DNA-binding response OmpR family regulator